MASKSSVLLSFLTSIFLTISSSEGMVFYLQETFGGPNSTLIVVAGLNGTSSSIGFGTMGVLDDGVTAGPKRSSRALGRAHGVLTAISSTGFHVNMSVVFENGKYNGSTLQIQGTAKSFFTPREFSIVGGTGLFRYARGFVTVNTVASSGFDYTYKYHVNLRLD